jgi:hypothetical protein
MMMNKKNDFKVIYSKDHLYMYLSWRPKILVVPFSINIYAKIAILKKDLLLIHI